MEKELLRSIIAERDAQKKAIWTQYELLSTVQFYLSERYDRAISSTSAMALSARVRDTSSL